MALILFDKDAVVDYVPEWNGNRESDEPLVVKLRFVGYARVQHYAKMLRPTPLGTGSPLAADRILEVQKKQFMENVVGFENCNVTDPGEFYERVDADLIYEIFKAMESQAKLTEGQAKNFSRAFVGNSDKKTEARSTAEPAPSDTGKLEIAGTDVDSAIEREG